MHIEFIDLLRCQRPHEDSWLVATLDKMEGRQVVEARLGCPVCGAEYAIRNGVALFDRGALEWSADNAASPAGKDEAETLRLAAFLDLTRPNALILLVGELGLRAEPIATLTQTRVIAFNAPATAVPSDMIAEIRAGTPIPLADKSLEGIALDHSHSTTAMVSESARLLRPSGRLVGDAALALSPEFRELARDADYVVAEFIGALVPLRH